MANLYNLHLFLGSPGNETGQDGTNLVVIIVPVISVVLVITTIIIIILVLRKKRKVFSMILG